MRVYLFVLGCLCFSSSVLSQGNAKVFEMPKASDKDLAPDDNESIIEYESVADRSILWSKIVWETIDLSLEENKDLYFPVDTLRTEKRSLYYTLLKALKAGRITAYTDSYFEDKRVYEDLLPAIQKRDTTSAGFELLNQGKELTEAYISQRDISAYDIKEYRLKGVWYFDKRRSELRFRILGIAPVAPDVNFIDLADSENGDDYKVELFWLWYPQIRPILAATPSFNAVNTNFPISFDRLLNTRNFISRIYKTDNELDDIEALQKELGFPDFSSGTEEEQARLDSRKGGLLKMFKGKDKETKTDSTTAPESSVEEDLEKDPDEE